MTPKLLRGGVDGRGGRAGLRTGPKCGQRRATAAEVVFAVVAKRSDGAEDLLRELPSLARRRGGRERAAAPPPSAPVLGSVAYRVLASATRSVLISRQPWDKAA
jgi:hypothetical protein